MYQIHNLWHKSFKFFDKVLNIILELLKRWQRQQNSEKLDNHMESNFLIEKVLELDDKTEQLSYFYLSIISLIDNLR